MTQFTVSEPEKKVLSNKTKYLTTFGIFIECITYGAAVSFLSPVLVDLKNKYNTDVESISRIFIVFTAGYLAGAFTGGQAFGRFIKRQHGVIIAFSVVATTMILTPMCPSMLTLFINASLMGFACGAYDTAQVVWIIEMWQSKSGPYIQAQHFCFAIGSNIPALIVQPFLGKRSSHGAHALHLTEEVTTETSWNDTFIEEVVQTENSSNLQIPFTIGAGLAIYCVCYELFMIACFPYYKPAPEVDAPNSNPNNNALAKEEELEKSEAAEAKSSAKWYRIKLIVASGLFMGFCVGMEMSSISFIPTLAQYSGLKLSEAEGALVLTGLTGAFTAGRAIGILITFKVSPQIILLVNLIFVVIGNCSLLFWSNTSYEMMWVGSISLGFGFSTLYASYYTYIQRHLKFTDQLGSIMLVCGSLVATIYPLIVGKYIEGNPVVLTYTNFLSVGICTGAFLFVYFLTTRRVKQQKQLKSVQTSDKV